MLIYTLDLTGTKWTDTEDRLILLLSKDRQAKILRYRFENDRLLSLYAGLLARYAISKFSGIASDKLDFAYTEKKAPQLTYPKDCFFNISHTKDRVLCAVSTSPVGVDIEYIRDMHLDVMNRSFNISERNYVNSYSSDNDRSKAFFDIWTQKEAYTKYLGCGLACNIQAMNTLDEKIYRDFFHPKISGYSASVYSPTDRSYDFVEISISEIIKKHSSYLPPS